jgi:hypothetical protein
MDGRWSRGSGAGGRGAGGRGHRRLIVVRVVFPFDFRGIFECPIGTECTTDIYRGCHIARSVSGVALYKSTDLRCGKGGALTWQLAELRGPAGQPGLLCREGNEARHKRESIEVAREIHTVAQEAVSPPTHHGSLLQVSPLMENLRRAKRAE